MTSNTTARPIVASISAQAPATTNPVVIRSDTRTLGVSVRPVPGRRHVRHVVETHAYGPDNPIVTPPGARTTAIVTPSITRVGR
jgi:hypothetical protein